MRKLLQSKAVVSLLVLVAITAVTANFVSIPKLLGMTASARSPLEAAADPVEPAVKMPPVSRLTDEQKLWRDLFPASTGVRDPFAPPIVQSPVTAALPTASIEPVALVLQAISCEPKQSYAVINQKVVTLGDRLFGYTVDRILPGSVELLGPTGPVSLTLKRGARSQNPPSGKPSNTDLPAAVPQSSVPGPSR